MSSDYERGLAEGKVAGQVASHARRLDAINGSVADTANQLRSLTVQITALTVSVDGVKAGIAENQALAAKYVPIVDQLERNRLSEIKHWQLVAALVLMLLPQVINLTLRLSGM